MFDSHAHLQDSRFDGILSDVLEHAVKEDVTGICCCGTSPADWHSVREVQDQSDQSRLVVIPAFGVHPWHVGDLKDGWLDKLAEYLDQNPVAVVGEIGLDGIRKDVSRELQKKILTSQLELAVSHSRAVVLHGARAWGDLIAAVKPHAAELPAIVAHGFSGSAEILKGLLSLGAYVSFAGSVCNPKAARARAAAALVPGEKLLIETDAPDLFPNGGAPAAMDAENRPLNQPSNLKLIRDQVAELRNLSSDLIADMTASNARGAFLD